MAVIRDEPLDRGHAVPAGDDQANRAAMLGGQGRTVHLVGEQDVGVEGHREGSERWKVILFGVAVHRAAICAREEDLDTAEGRGPARERSVARGTPRHWAVLTAPEDQGSPLGRGARPRRLLPAHSSVEVSARRAARAGRDRRWRRGYLRGAVYFERPEAGARWGRNGEVGADVEVGRGGDGLLRAGRGVSALNGLPLTTFSGLFGISRHVG